MQDDSPNPADAIIRRFGGQSALAALLGRRQSTIEHWASTGRIPAQWHGPLMALARQRGVILEAKDFTAPQPQQIEPATGSTFCRKALPACHAASPPMPAARDAQVPPP